MIITVIKDFLTTREVLGKTVQWAIERAEELTPLELELLASIEQECARLAVRATLVAKKLGQIRASGYEDRFDYRG
jgi:hypothetical protein